MKDIEEIWVGSYNYVKDVKEWKRLNGTKKYLHKPKAPKWFRGVPNGNVRTKVKD